jgi:hypothetical protein
MRAKAKTLAGLTVGTLMIVLTPSAFAGEWMADAKTGCKVWDAVPEPGETVTWSGPCENGYTSGTGTLTWFKNGKPSGGYVGERAAGKANGHGINVWLGGDRYEGGWKDDMPNGKGTYTWANNSGYQGGWDMAKKQGKAVYIWPNGDRFEGIYDKDLPVSGLYIKADGRRYVATINNDGLIQPSDQRIYTTDDRLSVRQVGTKVCRAGSPVLGMLKTKMVGFVETVTDTRVQIRIVDPGTLFGQNYRSLPIGQNTIIWDDPDKWGPCETSDDDADAAKADAPKK